jgi:hypothetical protein
MRYGGGTTSQVTVGGALGVGLRAAFTGWRDAVATVRNENRGKMRRIAALLANSRVVAVLNAWSQYVQEQVC